MNNRSINWRIIIGLGLLLFGIAVLYTALNAKVAPGSSNLGGKIGSIIWIAVGLYLLVKGMTNNEEKL